MGPLQVFVCKPYESIKAWKTCRDFEAGSHSFIETVCGFEAHMEVTRNFLKLPTYKEENF